MKAFVVFVALHALDLLTTFHAVTHGATEMNPVFASTVNGLNLEPLVLFKGLIAAACGAAYWWVGWGAAKPQPRIANMCMWAACLPAITVVGNNVYWILQGA